MTFKLAFISGAGSGLGKELAYQLALKKIPLFLTSKDSKKLTLVTQDLEKHTTIFSLAADLSDPFDLKKVLGLIKEKCPDLVINNAGLGLYGEILSFDLARQMKILELNINALVQISIESARALRKNQRPGILMNISSCAALFTYPGFALYAASKGFVKDFSQSFDEEMSNYNIRVLTCLPGRFHSDFRKNALGVQHSYVHFWDTMSIEKTAAAILKQIEKKKAYQIIDWRYQILYRMSQLLSKKWVSKRLKKETKKISMASTDILREDVE